MNKIIIYKKNLIKKENLISGQNFISNKDILLGNVENKQNHNSRLPNKYLLGIQKYKFGYKYGKKINPIHNIKLKPINYIGEIKKKSDCIDAYEYINQFSNSNLYENYDIDEINTKLDHLKKILIKQNIFFIKTPWDSVWNNLSYSIDFTHDYIYNRYQQLIFKRYDSMKNFSISLGYENYTKYSKNILCMLFIDRLVSYLSVSNYLFCISKINGELNIQCNFFNINDKNIILNCIGEIFYERFIYDEVNNIIILYLKKI